MSSPSTVLTRGLGPWSTASLLVTRGFGIHIVPPSHVQAVKFEAVQVVQPWVNKSIQPATSGPER